MADFISNRPDTPLLPRGDGGEAGAGEILQRFLSKRQDDQSIRSLPNKSHLVDFCSNDYLGFSRSALLREKIKRELERYGNYSEGATGSRLITGNLALFEDLEELIAKYHYAEAGLIFNSGYVANLGFFASVPQENDLVLYDELVHASIRDGIKLTRATAQEFRHNDLNDLKYKLGASRHSERSRRGVQAAPSFPARPAGGDKLGMTDSGSHSANSREYDNIYIAVESVYSMDGDFSPLAELAAICRESGANLVVDEAHAVGLYGPKGEGRVVESGLEKDCFARVCTFSKALGCQGAIILGSETLKQFLINFSRPFIFSTALSFHSLVAVKCAYDILSNEYDSRLEISRLIRLFKQKIKSFLVSGLIPSESPIQSIIIPGNENALKVSNDLEEAGFYAKAILYPTVPRGKERIRFVIHSFNTEEEVLRLCSGLHTDNRSQRAANSSY